MEKFKQYLTGHGGGSGQYEMFYAHLGKTSVSITHFPEDFGKVRVVSNTMAVETTFILDEREAHCLWSALNKMALNRAWQDSLEGTNKP